MRELTADLFSTVDGWASGRNSPGYFGDAGPDLQAWIDEQLARPHVMLMGSNTYTALAEIAAAGGDPTMPDASPAFKRMDELPKVVFSKSLKPPLTCSNTSLVAEDVAVAVPAMKDEPGDPMRVIGSLTLVRSLFRLGQVDRLRLMVFPQVLGESGQERILQGCPMSTCGSCPPRCSTSGLSCWTTRWTKPPPPPSVRGQAADQRAGCSPVTTHCSLRTC
jgi:dihydrofolate reductase